MSSLSTPTTLIYITEQINIYCGLFILISGVIGGLLNIIIFTSLKTFRNTSCAFYLAMNSIVNLGELVISLLVRILADGFNTDPTGISWFCKLRVYFAILCTLLSLTSLCLAAVDQFLSMTKFRHWCKLQIAQRHIFIASILWCGYCISILVFEQSTDGVCTINNTIYANYMSYFHYPVLSGCLPLTIMIVFSLLAFFIFRTTASRQMNAIRLSRDRQLSAMTLIQVISVVIASVPLNIYYIYKLQWSSIDSYEMAYSALISTITSLIFYGGFAVSLTSKENYKIYFCRYNFCFISDSFLRLLFCIKSFS
jgi:hypothetical protein